SRYPSGHDARNMAVGRPVAPSTIFLNRKTKGSMETHGKTRRNDLPSPPNHALTIGFPTGRATRGRAPVDFRALSRDLEGGENKCRSGQAASRMCPSLLPGLWERFAYGNACGTRMSQRKVSHGSTR